MNANQKALRAVADELDTIEARSAEIIAAGEINDDGDKEIRELAAKKKTLIERRQALAVLIEAEDVKTTTTDDGGDPETRERLKLRSKAMVSNYLLAHAKGKLPSGAEAELASAAGVTGIPIELWDLPERRVEERAVAAAPGERTLSS